MPEIIYKTQAAAGYLTPLYDESIKNQFTSPLQVLHNLSGSLSFATSSSYTRLCRWVMKMVKCRFNTQKVSNSFFRLPVTRRCFRLVMVRKCFVLTFSTQQGKSLRPDFKCIAGVLLPGFKMSIDDVTRKFEWSVTKRKRRRAIWGKRWHLIHENPSFPFKWIPFGQLMV